MLKKFKFIAISFLCFVIYSCEKKEEPQTFIPPQQETNVDKEKELKEKEEFERLKNLQDTLADTLNTGADTSGLQIDSLKTSEGKKEDKKKFVQKEKELNKRLDNPKTAVTDYIEFLKRGTSEGGNFEQNMKKANDLWESGNLNRFKTNYKNTKKLIVLEEPKVISQKGNEAVVQVKIKKVDEKNGKNEETEMTVKYNLIADSKGKWKIKNNVVTKK
ncbi:MAG: hypothetical protein HGGPFJEG_00734 [Ignavibacteria bacterium]|nr:hypothetical protein [Ignavibacteria bacterium]